ncbi:MAG: ABC transporter substrate-binding protein [Candidatus Rokuibacteriota bacterium]|nr:MAG: ABC transporter substrate-binding protein [Candidatus Rokubacteria bacterium]
MMTRRGRMSVILVCLAAMLGTAGATSAQDKPRYGGELVFVVAAEPPSYDAHREETFGMLHPAAPHYSTLLRVDPFDKTGTKFVGDLAESWTVSADKRTYTFKLRQGVKFHDGSVMTSRDVKASYDRIINPPPTVVSSRQAQYKNVEAVEALASDTIVFRLKYPEASFTAGLASPWNWIYKADILAKDQHWYEKNVMGTGPFKLVEYVHGSHWLGKKNPDYWDRGKPYLDGYRAIFIPDAAAQVSAIRGERAMIQFRGFSPQQRDSLVAALGNKLTVQESPWNCSIQVALNQQKRPFEDRRVRRALTLALDRWSGSKALSRIAVVKEVAGIQVPGTPWASPTEELVKLAGYGTDINASRAEARRLLKEAGYENLSFTLLNRGVPMPYEPVGIWLIDQWRQIGLNIKQVVLESASWLQAQKNGDFEVSTNAPCNTIVEPDLDLHWFLTTSPVNFSKHKDTVMDDLYTKQSRATDPEERRKLLRAFQKRLYDEEVHYIHTFQWHRIVPHLSKVRGWTITPSHYLNNQLDTVWLSE